MQERSTPVYVYIQFNLNPVIGRPPLLNLKSLENIQSMTQCRMVWRYHGNNWYVRDVFPNENKILQGLYVLAVHHLQWPIIMCINPLTVMNIAQSSKSVPPIKATISMLLLRSHVVVTSIMSRVFFLKIRSHNVPLFLGVQHVYSLPLPTHPPVLLYILYPNPDSSPLSSNSLLK